MRGFSTRVQLILTLVSFYIFISVHIPTDSRNFLLPRLLILELYGDVEAETVVGRVAFNAYRMRIWLTFQETR